MRAGWLGRSALLLALALPPRLEATPGGAIPAFARKYRTSCLTCHVMPPRLNPLGEAFRLNGYRFPRGDADLVRDSAVVLGAPEWRELFPQAVWPSSIPGGPPLAMRVIADYESRAHVTSGFLVPVLMQLIAAGAFDEATGFFLETAWTQGSGANISQAFVKFQHPLRFTGLAPRALNLWVGKFDQNFLPSARLLDNLYRTAPLWGSVRLADLRVDSAGANRTSGTLFRGHERQPGIELNGLVGARLAYAVGVVQGVEAARDVDTHRDVYYTVRAKAGGRAFDGTIGPEAQRGSGGRWVDNALQLEHFGYFGRQRIDPYRRLGVALRGTLGDFDAAGGYVWGRHDRPWSSPGEAEVRSWFGRVDYMAFPWLLGSLRVEDVRIAPTLPPGWRVTPGGAQDLQRVLPAVVMLVRANMRLVVEGEWYRRDAAVAAPNRRHALAARLDLAF
jgi:hypothetical protein